MQSVITCNKNSWFESSVLDHDLLSEEWIKNNKPTEKKIARIRNNFKSIAIIQGDDEFVSTLDQVINQASVLATGSVILTKILKVAKHVKFIQSQDGKNQCLINGDVCLCLSEDTFYSATDPNNEVVLIKKPEVATVLHELAHLRHLYKNKKAFEKRLEEESLWSEDMHNKEEEWTIRGKIYPKDSINFCCENNVLRELGYYERINHLGVHLKKNQLPSIFDMLKQGALGDLRKELKEKVELIETTLVPENIKESCFKKLSVSEFPLDNFVDLAILMGAVKELRLFIELGWQPVIEHLNKALLAYDVYNELLQDKSRAILDRKYTTEISDSALVKSKLNLEQIIHVLHLYTSTKNMKDQSPH